VSGGHRFDEHLLWFDARRERSHGLKRAYVVLILQPARRFCGRYDFFEPGPDHSARRDFFRARRKEVWRCTAQSHWEHQAIRSCGLRYERDREALGIGGIRGSANAARRPRGP